MARTSKRKKAEPTVMTPLQEFVHAIGKSYNAPPTVPAGMEPYALALLAVACLSKTPEKDLASGDPGPAANRLLAEKEDLMLIAAGHVGTHETKLANASVETSTISDQGFSKRIALPVVDSSNVALRRTMTGTGNGANNRMYRFLTAAVGLNGRTVKVEEILAETQGLMRTASRGLDSRSYEFLCKCRNRMENSRASMPKAVDMRSPILRVPTGDGDYRALTPVVSAGLMIELRNRLEERKEDQEFKLARQKTGGKPQNAGLAASDMAGVLPKLRCLPPRRVKHAELSLRMIVSGSFRATNHDGAKEHAAGIAAALDKLEAKRNVENKAMVRDAVDSLVAHVGAPLSWLSDAAGRAGRQAAEDLKPHEDCIAAARVAGIGGKPEEEHIVHLVTAICDAAGRALAKEEIVIGDSLSEAIEKSARKFLEGLA